MVFIYKDKEYDVEIIKKNNKNIYIRVRNNKVYVTTNYFVTNKSIENLLKDNYKSIGKMIDRAIEREGKKDLFLLFGNDYDVIYGDFDKQINVEEGLIKVVDEKVLCSWLDKFIHTTYYNHLMYWYGEFKESIPIPTLKIRKMKTRWGVCNIRTNTVTLNLELFRYDIEWLDYVIIHELSHFIDPNTSKYFWCVVEKYCPNYKEIRRKLRS